MLNLMTHLLHAPGTILSCREEAIHYNTEAYKSLKLPAQVRNLHAVSWCLVKVGYECLWHMICNAPQP